jgi:hypothetical protein
MNVREPMAGHAEALELRTLTSEGWSVRRSDANRDVFVAEGEKRRVFGSSATELFEHITTRKERHERIRN